MAPILGIWASQITGKLSSYESIATVTVGAGGASTINFTSIPQTYQHLQLRMMAKSTNAGTYDYCYFNLDPAGGATDYARHRLTGDGSSATSYGQSAVSGMFGPAIPYASGGANVFGVGIIDILDYTNTNKYKTVRVLGGSDLNGSGKIDLTSGLWLLTSAVTQIQIGFPPMAQYSSFALYGIKG
jgi:hypothetical protein